MFLEDVEARVGNVVASLSALITLLESQVPGLSMPSEQLAPLLMAIAAQARSAEPAPDPRCCRRRRPGRLDRSND